MNEKFTGNQPQLWGFRQNQYPIIRTWIIFMCQLYKLRVYLHLYHHKVHWLSSETLESLPLGCVNKNQNQLYPESWILNTVSQILHFCRTRQSIKLSARKDLFMLFESNEKKFIFNYFGEQFCSISAQVKLESTFSSLFSNIHLSKFLNRFKKLGTNNLKIYVFNL